MYGHIRVKAECAVEPPPSDGFAGCVATMRRLMRGVGHTVPCGTARQAAVQAQWLPPAVRHSRSEDKRAVASPDMYDISCITFRHVTAYTLLLSLLLF